MKRLLPRWLGVVLLTSFCASLAVAPLAGEQPRTDATSHWEQTGEIAAPEANQAAAADEQYVYAITNAVVARYDRESGDRLAVSTGPAKHLNSGFFHEGKLYCAHSNFPRKPEMSEIKVLDLDSMELTTFKDFGNFGGSLTWAIHRDGYWWCNFAHYGTDNGRTFLVKFDSDWKETSRWTYPPEVVAELKAHSVSGGVWHDDRLLVTDHDHRQLYELRLPASGDVLEFVAKHQAPFTGQGIAHDPKTGGLIGIDRGKKKIVFATQQPPSSEP